jgi:beta propeller repeat protein
LDSSGSRVDRRIALAARVAAAAMLASACSLPREVPSPTLSCTAWTGTGEPARDGGTILGREARWVLVDRAGALVAYRSASRGLVVRRIPSGEERTIELGDGMSVFPSTFEAGRLLVFYSRRADGFQTYFLLDAGTCTLSPLPIIVSTADPDIGYSKLSTAALSGDRLFYAISRGSLAPAEEILLDLVGLARTEAGSEVHLVTEAALDGERVIWLEQRLDWSTPSVAEWSVADGTVTALALPALSRPQGLAVSGRRAVWTDFRDARFTPDENVFMADFSTGAITQLTADPAAQNQPSMLGDLVAWSDERSGSFDVRLRDLASGREVVAVATADDERTPVLTPGGLLWTVPSREGATIWFDPALRPETLFP